MERRRKNLTGKANWFKSAPKQRTREAPRKRPQQQSQEAKKRKPPVSVLFCPQTPNGTLARQLKEQESFLSQVCGESVKVIERSGSTSGSFLLSLTPGLLEQFVETQIVYCARQGEENKIAQKEMPATKSSAKLVMIQFNEGSLGL